MNANTCIAGYILPPTGVVSPTEPLHCIRRRMEAGELAPVIVADANRSAGVIRRSDIQDAYGVADARLARDIMEPGCPALNVDSPASEAYARLNLADLDQVPVVNACGAIANNGRP